jgi:hypothetical protein
MFLLSIFSEVKKMLERLFEEAGTKNSTVPLVTGCSV